MSWKRAQRTASARSLGTPPNWNSQILEPGLAFNKLYAELFKQFITCQKYFKNEKVPVAKFSTLAQNIFSSCRKVIEC